jgi:hypothetical protein
MDSFEFFRFVFFAAFDAIHNKEFIVCDSNAAIATTEREFPQRFSVFGKMKREPWFVPSAIAGGATPLGPFCVKLQRCQCDDAKD